MTSLGITRSQSGLSHAEQSSGVIDVSVPRPSRGPLVRGLVSLAAAVGVVLLVPWVMLLAGHLIALPVRVLAQVITWLVAARSGG